MNTLHTTLINAYLDRTNNFLTTKCFADYYFIEEREALHIINIGRRLCEQEQEHFKQCEIARKEREGAVA